MGRIVLFGATGYTGRLTAAALAAGGAPFLLAGRNGAALAELAAELEVDAATATADVSQPETVGALLGKGDVMLSTVGPFSKWGNPAIEAAIAAGASYLDSTGEPPFIRRVFEHFGPAAAAAGVPLLTAMGYDWVPGSLAAALAVEEAGDAVRRVDIGYFMSGTGTSVKQTMSGGTAASMLAIMLEPGFAYRSGRIVSEAAAKSVRSFEICGRDRPGVSAGAAEHFSLPQTYPQLNDVSVYIGALGALTRPMQAGMIGLGGLARLPGAKRSIETVLGRLAQGSTGGPDAEARAKSRSNVVAIARDGAGNPLAEVHLEGGNAYEFTAAFLAWAATELLAGRYEGEGAIGPVGAFGVDRLTEGVAAAGMRRA